MSTSPAPRPRAILFDIGGVCVVSPMQAILDYELARSIPPGWINFSISRSGPQGAWQRLERGEVPMDAAFFAAFQRDLTQPSLWAPFLSSQIARADEKDSRLSSALRALDPARPPAIEAEQLYWEMMRVSRAPDPHMWPAVAALRASGAVLVAALSNTSIFPADHPYSRPPAPGEMDVRAPFEVFVSSAHVGLRKPQPEIYELALREMRSKVPGLKPEEVVFLDDIGGNLKPARQLGFRTIKVGLGRTRDAVRELESITGLKLLGEGARL